jgi:TolA-binding protein
LLKANDDLTMANSELRTMNEQLLINSEEAASSHEEVETLNEEMQATNEELETLNEELQATVEELNTTNDELQSRSTDLEKLGESREQRLLRLERERDALAQALEIRGEMVAILGDDKKLLYISPSMAGDTSLKAPERLKDGSKVKLRDGREYVISQREIRVDGKVAFVISLSSRT